MLNGKKNQQLKFRKRLCSRELEIEPEFNGGQEALRKFLMENLIYPKIAIDSNIQGRVYATFIVEKDGEVTNASIKRGVHPSLDTEVLRLIAIMPNWKPGLKNNEPVRSRFMLPVKFDLSNDK